MEEEELKFKEIEFGIVTSSLESNIYHDDKRIGIPIKYIEKFYEISLKLFKQKKELEIATQGILFFNPLNYSALNVRKSLIKENLISKEFELRLTQIILSKHPKSQELWFHRYWILQQLKKVEIDLNLELKITEESFIIYPRNYYSWTHRINLIKLMNSKLLFKELKWSKKWISKHISDYSAVIYREELIKTFTFKNKVEEFDFLLELMFVADLILAFPGHESLWLHRDFVLSKIVLKESDINYSKKQAKEIIDSIYLKEPKFSPFPSLVTIQSEKLFLFLCITDTSQENYENQKEYAKIRLNSILDKN